jgi:hypothetical protein
MQSAEWFIQNKRYSSADVYTERFTTCDSSLATLPNSRYADTMKNSYTKHTKKKTQKVCFPLGALCNVT